MCALGTFLCVRACLETCGCPGPARDTGSMPTCGPSKEALLQSFHTPAPPRCFPPPLPLAALAAGSEARVGDQDQEGAPWVSCWARGRWASGGLVWGPCTELLPCCHPWGGGTCPPGDVAGIRLNSHLLRPGASLRKHGGVPTLRRWFQGVLGELSGSGCPSPVPLCVSFRRSPSTRLGLGVCAPSCPSQVV